MDFALSDDEALFQRSVREFAEQVLRPVAAAADERGQFPPDTLRATAELGLFGMLVPEGHGGAGLDTLRYVLALEEIARASASMAALLNIHNAVVCAPLARAGAAALQARWLPALARSEVLGAASLPALIAVQTGSPDVRAAQVDGGLGLDGRVAWVTNSGPAALYLVVAEDESSPALFLMEAEQPGLVVGSPIDKLGLRGATTADLTLAACKVPADARLGGQGGHPAVIRQARDLAAIGSAAQALGIAEASLDAAVSYARERHQFGRAIAEFDGLRGMLADVQLAIEAARLLACRAAWLRDRDLPYGRAAAMARLHTAQAAMQAANRAVQVHGGYGYMRESAVQRYFRDAKVTQATEGQSSADRATIADQLLPRGSPL